MKAIKGLLLFGISMLLVIACFNPPEFALEPQIDFKSIYFEESTGTGVPDALVFTISFKDGNGDLGLSSTEIDEPYHDEFYYLAEGGNLTPVGKRQRYSYLPAFVSIPAGATGKLVTVRTADDAEYADKLPPYIDFNTSCTFYTYTSIYVSEEDKGIFDETNYNIDRVLIDPQHIIPDIYVLLDTFYYKRNPNYANIDVEFWVEENGNFTLFDWEKEFCTISFNQRFPVLAEKTGPLKGDLQYAIETDGIKSIFSTKNMFLRIKIRDRSLNVSNVVETGQFTLDKIKKGG